MLTEKQKNEIKAEIRHCRYALNNWKNTENYSAINSYKERILGLYEILESEESIDQAGLNGYQEAWNKICEYIKKSGILSFHISPWDEYGNCRYSLQTVNINPDGEFESYTFHFSDDTPWKEMDKNVEIV